MHYGLGFLDLLSDFFRREIHESRAKSKWLVGYWDWLVGFLVREGDLTNMVGYQGLSHMTRLLCYEIGWFFRESHLFFVPLLPGVD
jgi:hypothetical protein